MLKIYIEGLEPGERIRIGDIVIERTEGGKIVLYLAKGSGPSEVRDLQKKYEQILKEIGRIEKDLAKLMKRLS